MQGGRRRAALIRSREAGADVVGVEHRVLGGLPHAVGAVREHVGERAHEHAHLAVEGGDAAERLRRVAGLAACLDELGAVAVSAHEGHRREGREPLPRAPPGRRPDRRRHAASRRSCAG